MPLILHDEPRDMDTTSLDVLIRHARIGTPGELHLAIASLAARVEALARRDFIECDLGEVLEHLDAAALAFDRAYPRSYAEQVRDMREDRAEMDRKERPWA